MGGGAVVLLVFSCSPSLPESSYARGSAETSIFFQILALHPQSGGNNF